MKNRLAIFEDADILEYLDFNYAIHTIDDGLFQAVVRYIDGEVSGYARNYNSQITKEEAWAFIKEEAAKAVKLYKENKEVVTQFKGYEIQS